MVSGEKSVLTAAEHAFALGIYSEHLEEASFLYQTRKTLLTDVTVPWPEVAVYEQRLDRHLTALVDGGLLALSVCGQMEDGSDAAAAYVLLRVLARHGAMDDVVRLTQAWAPGEAADAVADGLAAGWPRDRIGLLRPLAAAPHPITAAVFAQLIGFRRFPLEDALIAALTVHNNDPATAWIAWALGRLGAKAALPRLEPLLRQTVDPVAASMIATALLRLGCTATLALCRQQALIQAWPWTALALAGNRRDGRLLRGRLEALAATPDLVTALALHGERDHLHLLLELLDHSDDDVTAAACAMGLYLMTGAELFESVSVQEHIDQDELFDEEIEGLAPGDIPPGLTVSIGEVTRFSEDGERWRRWLDNQADRFRADCRYRLGQPVTPRVLVDQAGSLHLPAALRQLAYEELVIRYGLDVPFETSQTVAQQQAVLVQAQQAATDTNAAGAWFFAGTRLP